MGGLGSGAKMVEGVIEGNHFFDGGPLKMLLLDGSFVEFQENVASSSRRLKVVTRREERRTYPPFQPCLPFILYQWLLLFGCQEEVESMANLYGSKLENLASS